MTALSLMRLLPEAGRITSGSVNLGNIDLLGLPEAAMRAVRGRRVAMIFQEPATALNPVMTCGKQIVEVIERHTDGAGAREKALELLRAVGIDDPERRFDEYPFQLSGGLKQRVMIAGALAVDPEVLIADEPTTALDVTIQAQILDLLVALQRERGMALVLITHDMGVVAELAERVVVMYAGRVVEEAPKTQLFRDPQHPYTWGLLGSMPRPDRPRVRRLAAIPGAPPSLLAPPEGCRFEPRCPHRIDGCLITPALLERVSPGRKDACIRDPATRAALRAASLGDAGERRESA
jgi:oligopeptide/dipeptide ABC transporter ATP-binding protein